MLASRPLDSARDRPDARLRRQPRATDGGDSRDERKTSYRMPGCAIEHVRRPIRPYSKYAFYADFVTELQKRQHPRFPELEWKLALEIADEPDTRRVGGSTLEASQNERQTR